MWDSARARLDDDTLGELLKRKGSMGVRVLVLVLDDHTSVESLGMRGYMGCMAAETVWYFGATVVEPRRRRGW